MTDSLREKAGSRRRSPAATSPATSNRARSATRSGTLPYHERAAAHDGRRGLQHGRDAERRPPPNWRQRPTRPGAPSRRSPCAVGEVAEGGEGQVRAVESARGVGDEVAESAPAGRRARGRHGGGRRRSAREMAEDGQHAAGGRQRGHGRRTRGVTRRPPRRSVSSATRSEQIVGIVDTITGHRRADQPARAQRRDRGRPRRRAGQGLRGRRRRGAQAGGGVPRRRATIATLSAEIQSDTVRAVDVVEDGRRGAPTTAWPRSPRRARRSPPSATGSATSIARSARSRSRSSASSTLPSACARTCARWSRVAESASASTEQVSASAQQTSASTQEIAASAQGVADEAARLDQLVGQFVLRA